MRLRYALVYISLGIALALWLHAAVNRPGAEAERGVPSVAVNLADA
jgi:hypothetical protein